MSHSYSGVKKLGQKYPAEGWPRVVDAYGVIICLKKETLPNNERNTCMSLV